MTDTIARQPQGIPAGGQFAATAHTEPSVGLKGPGAAVPVQFQGQAVLNPAVFGSLPELPASVGTPEVSFSFSDAGKLATHVRVHGSTLSFWSEDDDEIANDIDNGHTVEGEVAPWSGIAEYEDFEKTRTWAESVHERVEGATSQILESAVESDASRAAIVAFATGRAEPAAKPTPQQESAKRAATAMAACEEGQGRETTMRDLFTDLRHYAEAHGIDFHQAMDDSVAYYEHEKTDPTFKDGY